MVVDALAGIGVGAAGVAALFASWRRRSRKRPGMTTAAWLLLGAAGYLWVRATGVEFGLVIALLVPALLAWVLVLRNAELRQHRDRDRDRAAVAPNAAPRPWLGHVALFLVAVPAAAAAAAFVSVALVTLLFSPAGMGAMTLVLVVVLMPVLWGCAAYWTCADPRLARPAWVIVASGALGAAFVYL